MAKRKTGENRKMAGKIAKNVMSICMTTVHQKCGSPKKHKACASGFLKKCISQGRKNAKKFTLAAAKKM